MHIIIDCLIEILYGVFQGLGQADLSLRSAYMLYQAVLTSSPIVANIVFSKNISRIANSVEPDWMELSRLD